MATVLRGGMFRRLADDEIVIPHLERALFSDKWPESYTITVDTSEHRSSSLPGEIRRFHPSSHCLMGLRRLYYEVHPDYWPSLPKDRFTMSSIMSLTMGTAAHSIVQTQLKMAGKIVDDEDIEVSFRNEDRHCSGRLDWLFTRANGTKIPVEMKTQNSRGFGQTKEILPSWECQLQVTMDGMGYEEGVLFVVEMGYPWQMREFRVRRDEEVLNAIYSRWNLVLEHVRANVPPKHCCERGSTEMDKCRARSVCWLAESQGE